MPDSPGFWDSLSNGYSYVKGKVSEGATWTENRVSQTADSIQKQLDQTDPVGSAEFGIVRGAGGVLYNAAKGTVGTVVDLGEAGVAGAKWVYNNPQQAWQNTKDAAAYVDDLMSDPNKMLALAQQGGGLVYTKLAGLTKQQWEEFKGDIAAANTPGEMGQVAGKWAAKLGLTVYAVRSAIQGLKAICEGGAATAAEEGGAAKSLKGAAGDDAAASEAGAAKGASEEKPPGSSKKGTTGDDEPPYGKLEDPDSVGEGKEFTAAQKAKIIEENRARNGGEVVSDYPDDIQTPLKQPQKSQRGVTPPNDEWQIDHYQPKDQGGTNSYSNARVSSREYNRQKSNKWPLQ